MKNRCVQKITNMATVQIFEFASDWT